MARKFPRATTEAHRDSHGEPSGHYGAAHENAHRSDVHRRARIEIEFDEQTVLGALFGQFDTNLVLIENRLGVYISARGNKALIEGPDDAVARARVINGDGGGGAAERGDDGGDARDGRLPSSGPARAWRQQRPWR